MERIERIVETKEVLFVANNETVHNTELECRITEWKENATKVYGLFKRGQRTDEAEIYSTEELAMLNGGNDANYYVAYIYMDERDAIEKIKYDLVIS